MKKLLTALLITGTSLAATAQQYTVILNFNATDGGAPQGSLILLGNKMYGLTPFGNYSDGNIFSIDKNGSNDNSFYNFRSPSNARGTLLYAGHKLYGMTPTGGINGKGNIFCIDTDGANYKDLWDFDGGGDTNGSEPWNNNLIIVGGRLYGMTVSGGTNKAGNIFKIDTDGTNYKDLYNFSFSGPWGPSGSLLLVNNHLLYGTTAEGGGVYFGGNIFSIDTSGANFTDRYYNFPGASFPYGSLILVGKLLYGMTFLGGTHSEGNIFSIDTNAINTTYKDRWDFDIGGDTNGRWPFGDLTYSGKVLYGMTEVGGTNSEGNIFRIDTDGTRYTDLLDFNGANGSTPYGNVTLSGNVLYGMTREGGTGNAGVIFADTLIKLNTTYMGGLCANTGEATVNVSGGLSPFTYSWTNGSTTNNATGLSAGTYSVTVTDNNGLMLTSSVTIIQPAILATTIATHVDITCFGSNNGSATANAATGGTYPYTYLWSDAASQTNLTATGLSAGSYTITATDNNGCTASAAVIVTQPTAIVSAIATQINVTCFGNNNGSATANVATGGTSPYTYLWSDAASQTNLAATGLSAGSYTITTTDNNGCTLSAGVIVTQPTAIVSTIATQINVTCFGNNNGSATANATGGTSPYTYLWSDAASQTNLAATGLSPGSYTITTTDANQCTTTASVTITQPVAISATIYMVNDTGNNSGMASIVPTGGTSPYTYLWQPGSQKTDTITGLGGGTYSVSVTDNNGCTYSTTITIDNTTGIVSINSTSAHITVYPNPSNGQFTLQSSVNSEQWIVDVYNILGKEVYSDSYQPMTNSYQLNLSNQPNGIYLYRVLDVNQNPIGSGKLVIER